MTDKVNLRELSLDILMDVDKNQNYSNQLQHNVLMRHQYLDKKERAFFNRLTSGTIEQRIYLDYMINQVSKTKLSKCKPLIRNLLRMSAYQIFFMDSIPDGAVCNEAVKLARKRGFSTLTGFVNGVLRNLIRNKDTMTLPDPVNQHKLYLSVRYSMPEWLVALFLSQYGKRTEQLLQAFLKTKDTCIRCNESNISVKELKEQLMEQGIQVREGAYVSQCLRISGYDYIRKIPGFLRGDFQVQDESSMMVGMIANPQKDALILDCCAAPGGKSIHVADLLKQTGMVVSRDVSQEKVDLIDENIERCGFHNIKTEVWDATILDENSVAAMDVVLADVPCSGLGIIGRKGDIKYRLREESLNDLVALQRDILKNAATYVKPGGYLIFSTCTLNYHENEENVKWIRESLGLESVDLNPVLPEELKDKHTGEGYLKLIPGIHETDGFFIAKFKKPV